jgi:hypothetical protein
MKWLILVLYLITIPFYIEYVLNRPIFNVLIIMLFTLVFIIWTISIIKLFIKNKN